MEGSNGNRTSGASGDSGDSAYNFDFEDEDNLIQILSQSVLDGTGRAHGETLWLVAYEITTLYLRYKLIEGLVHGNQLRIYGEDRREKASELKSGPEKYYKILALIYRYLGEIKPKFSINGIKAQLEYFTTKMQ